MRDIEGYKIILNDLAEKGSKEFINNSSADHAAVMIETLFKHADGIVRILTDHLTPCIYDRTEIKEMVNEFLKKDNKNRIHVIMLHNLEEEEYKTEYVKPKDNNFIQSLKENKDKIKLFEATSDKLKGFPNHFMVINTRNGHYALRVETNLKEHIATGSFNSEDIGKSLCTFFDKYSSDSDHVIEIEEAWQN